MRFNIKKAHGRIFKATNIFFWILRSSRCIKNVSTEAGWKLQKRLSTGVSKLAIGLSLIIVVDLKSFRL